MAFSIVVDLQWIVWSAVALGLYLWTALVLALVTWVESDTPRWGLGRWLRLLVVGLPLYVILAAKELRRGHAA